jgi:hypothetical protein
MAISVVWDNPEKSIIRFDFAGKWNWYGYEMAVGEAFGMMAGMNHIVDLIFNMQDSDSLPEGATLYIKRTLELSPNPSTVIIIVHAHASAEALVTMFSRIYKKLGERLMFARTLEKAYALYDQPASPAPTHAPKSDAIRLIAAR